jgi:hypothetical protein
LLGDARPSEVRLPPDGFTFDAAPESFRHAGLLASKPGTMSGVARSNETTSRADGRFGRQSQVGAFVGFEIGGDAPSSDRSQSGTHHGAGGEIVLSFNDGRIVRWPCFIADDGTEGPILWLDSEPAELAAGVSPPSVPARREPSAGTSAQASRAGQPALPTMTGAAMPVPPASRPGTGLVTGPMAAVAIMVCAAAVLGVGGMFAPNGFRADAADRGGGAWSGRTRSLRRRPGSSGSRDGHCPRARRKRPGIVTAASRRS